MDNRGCSYMGNLENRFCCGDSSGATGPPGPTGPTGPTGPGANIWQPAVLGTNYGRTELTQDYNFWGSEAPLEVVGQSQLTGFNNSGSSNSFTPTSVRSIFLGNATIRDSNNELIESVVNVNDILQMDSNSFDGSIFTTTNQTSMNNQSLISSNVIGRQAQNGAEIQESVVLCTPNSRYQFIGPAINNANSIIIQSNENAVSTDLNGANGSCVISNQVNAISITTPRQFVAGEFDNFFLRTLNTGSGNIVNYDPVTGELFDSGSPSLSSMTPSVEGVAYGLTSNSDPTVSLGFQSLNSYTPQGQPNEVVGTLNLSDLDPTVTNFASNAIISDSFLSNIGSITDFSGNVVLGMDAFTSNAITSMTNNILIGGGGGDSKLSNLNTFTTVSDNIALTTDIITYAAANMNLGSICLSTSEVQNLDVRSICLTAGSVVDLNSNQGSVVIVPGPTAISLGAFSGCCVLGNGLGGINPNASNQLSIAHQTIKAENLSNSTPTGTGQQHLFFDTATFQIRRANVGNTAMSRIFRATGVTNASGQISFNLASLSLTTNPIVTATVQDSSTVIGYVAQINALSTTNVTIQVMQSTTVVLAAQSMIPTGAGRTVHIHVAY